MADGEGKRRSRSLYASPAEMAVARAALKAVAEDATQADFDALSRALYAAKSPSPENLVEAGSSRPHLEGDGSTRFSGSDGEGGADAPVDESGLLSFDPLQGDAKAAGVEIPANGDDDGGGDDAADGKAKKANWKEFVPLLTRIPSAQVTNRERALRYLVLQRGPAATPVASTLTFRRAIEPAHFTDTEQEFLLTMPARLAQAFYTNLVQGGDGLSRYAP